MSLILDALKKSENERKSGATPSIADVRSAPEQSNAPPWLWWLIGLLAVNVLVLLFVLTRADSPKTERVVETLPATERPANATSRPSQVVLPTPAGALKEPVRSLAREASKSTATSQTREESPEPSVEKPVDSPAGYQVPEREPTSSFANLPSLSELQTTGSLNIPELHVDLHVYHETASRRLVFINGTKYVQGQTITEGPRIDLIRPDGVAMSFRGVEFLLSRD